MEELPVPSRNRPERPRILVVGSINMDLVVRTSGFPRPGETVAGGDQRQVPGGKGANQAAAAARMGARVAMVGAVGRDALGEALLRGLREDRIDTAGIRRLSRVPTGVAFIAVDRKGENQIIVSPGANSRVTPALVCRAHGAFRRARLVLLQNEIPQAAVGAALELARRLGRPAILNPAPARALPRKFLRRLLAVILNEPEAETILGAAIGDERSARRAAALLAARVGGGIAVLTRGARGALVAARGRIEKQPAFPARVVDTTAAGDAFTGVFAALLLETGDPFTAARAAAAAGALAVSRPGARSSLPRRGEVVRLAGILGRAPGGRPGGRRR